MTTENATTGASPRGYDCPSCEANAGAACRYPNGQSMGQKYHAPRTALAMGALDAALPALPPRVTAPVARTAANDVRNNSICVMIRLSRFSARRTVKQDDVNVAATSETGKKAEGDAVDQDMVTVAKDLLDSAELRAIVTFDHYTKLWFKSRSVPSPLLRSSAYLFAVDALPEMYGFLEQRAKDRGPLVDAFATALPSLKMKARERLGPLFDPSEYPRVDAVRRLFAFEWQVVEIGTPDQKLRGVSQSLFEKEKAKAEQVWASAVGQINDALAAGMADVVSHLSDRLGAGDEAPKRFRESAIRKVTDFLDAFGQRNIAGNADLAGLVDQARKLLSGVDAKELKAKDAGTRQRVAAGFAEIKGSLDKMLEGRPARAAVTDEEV